MSVVASSSSSSDDGARAALMRALQPFIEWAGRALLEEVVRGEVGKAMSESAAEEFGIEKIRLRIARLLPELASELICEEVRWRTPEIAKDAIVEEARSVIEESRVEFVWRSLLEPSSSDIFRSVVMETFADIESDIVYDNFLDDAIREVVVECYPLFLEARNNDVLDKIKSAATEHTLNAATLRHLLNLLGSGNFSVLIHRALSLRTTSNVIGMLSDTLSRAAELRNRLASEPILAHAIRELVYRPACIKALLLDLEESLERHDEETVAIEERS